MKRHPVIAILISIVLLVIPLMSARAQSPVVVRVVLFYSPTCGHCQYVISETILPLMEEYREQLQILGLDVTQPEVQPLYLAALDKFGIERGGVPFLVIDNMYLSGSVDIPEKFPGLVEDYLAQGGTDWPEIPGLREATAGSSEADNPTSNASAAPTEEATAAAPTQTTAYQPTPVAATIAPTLASPLASSGLGDPEVHNTDWRAKFANDPAGNTLAVIVLAGMLGASIWAADIFRRTRGNTVRGDWA
ncbi:MAG: thioredoxin family protein, partial [Chloroflexota bacterium]